MNRGEVYYCADFEFEDGGHAPKLLLVCNDPQVKQNVYFVLATSQEANKRKKDIGCQPSRMEFFIKAGNEFEKDTWLQLDRVPFSMPLDVANKIVEDNVFILKKQLSDQRMNEIRNCIDKHCSMFLSRCLCEMLGINFKG